MSMKTGCCTICLEPLFKDIQVSHCGHVYHRSCIYRWIDINNSCPNCKQHLDASQLTNLFLEPAEIIREVLNDPTILEGVDSELLLKIYEKQDDDDVDVDDDIDLEIIKNPKKNKKKSSKMELVKEKGKNTALTKQNEELNQKIVELTSNLKKIETEKRELNQKIQGYLRTADHFENKYFIQCDEIKSLNTKIYKLNKTINESKLEIKRLNRQQSMLEHFDAIKVGNINVIKDIESNVDSRKSKDEQATYYKSMYEWVLNEYQKSKSDKQRDKMAHQQQQKTMRDIVQDQRIKMQSFQNDLQDIHTKYQKYKKFYYGLKEKYDKIKSQKKKMEKDLKQKNDELQQQQQQQQHNMPDIIRLSIDNEQELNDVNSVISHSEDIENVDPKNENENDEDDDLIVNNKINDSDIGVFVYPKNNLMGYGGHRKSTNSLFATYRQLKTKQDNNNNCNNGHNPFSNGFNGNRQKKRNFNQFSKGNDGRGGTKTFLTENTNFHNNVENKHKRRRTIKSSSSSNNNINKKTNIANYFKRSTR